MTARVICTPLGTFTAVVDCGAVMGLSAGARLISAPEEAADTPLLDALEIQLNEYAHGRRTVFDLPVQLCGTAFQSAVWRELVKVSYGHTVTYWELAQRIGKPNAQRAVGHACGQNPVLILVPCHRVVAANGIGGFSAPMRLKTTLLALEQQVAAHNS